MQSNPLSSANNGDSTRPVSDHFDGTHFFNPGLPKAYYPRPSKGLKMLFEKRSRWPASVENKAVPRLQEKLSSSDTAVTFVNHATFLFQKSGINILTDPIWSKRASPFRRLGPARVREPGVRFNDLPEIHLVLLSHNHYDHLDVETLKALAGRFDPLVLVAAGDKQLVESTGLKRVHELDWWDEIEIHRRFKITFTPAQHFSARGLFDRQKSLWGGYMIEEADQRIYFAGDSGYSTHFSAIKSRLGPPDIAFLGIGAYEPRWFMKPVHMNPMEAVKAHIDLGSKQSVGMHFGTFHMSAESIDQPLTDLKAALLNERVPEEQFVTLHEGETRVFNIEQKAAPSGAAYL
jgi:L-ascorbate metabolism protein UlaG (beta-lactamase superfamily)